MQNLVKLICRGVVGIFAIYGAIKLAEETLESEKTENDINMNLDCVRNGDEKNVTYI